MILLWPYYDLTMACYKHIVIHESDGNLLPLD